MKNKKSNKRVEFDALKRASHPNRQVAILRFLILILLFSTAAYADGTTSTLLNQLIKTIHPKMQLIQPSEIDQKSCGNDISTYIGADFNGDNIKDYAGLFRSITAKDAESYGRKYKLYDGKLVAFLGMKDGHYKSVIITGSGGELPFIEVLYVQPKGNVHGVEGDRVINLQNDAIGMVTCEKSATVFYWHNGSFKELWTAD